MSLENERFFAMCDKKNMLFVSKSQKRLDRESKERRISIINNQIRGCYWEKPEGYEEIVLRLEKKLKKLENE
jgi:hypothetical protein